MLFPSFGALFEALWVAVSAIPWWFALIGVAMIAAKPLAAQVKRYTRNQF